MFDKKNNLRSKNQKSMNKTDKFSNQKATNNKEKSKIQKILESNSSEDSKVEVYQSSKNK